MTEIDKRTVARGLDEISRYLELSDSNKFRAIAFRNAARKVEDLQTDMQTFVDSGAVHKTAGIGKAIGPMIVELVQTGSLGYLDDLRKQYPPGILQLMRVPGLGMKKIQLLYERLGVGDVATLEEACRNNQLIDLPGFGKKTQEKILAGLEFVKKQTARFLLPRGLEAADAAKRHLEELPGIEEVIVSGAVRRRLEVITAVDLVASSKNPAKAAAAIAASQVLSNAEQAAPVGSDPTGAPTVQGFGKNEVPVTIHVCKPAEVAETLFVTTGSEEFVRAAGKPRDDIEPELRETAEWLDRKHGSLVSLEDIRGTFHTHTTYSDGRATLAEMLAAAREHDLDYVGISDHSKTAAYAGGLTEDRVAKLQQEIESAREEFAPMRIFKGTEADILTNGDIDYGPETLATFDFVVASVHSQFKMPKKEMTDRMVRAMHNPFVTFLGHMTGRLLLSREGYQLDFDRVFEAAAENGVIIEINGNPRRLDVDWRHIQRALEIGVIFSIHPDAHSIGEFNFIQTGVWVARKGGLEPHQVFNTLPVAEVAAHLERRRKRAQKFILSD